MLPQEGAAARSSNNLLYLKSSEVLACYPSPRLARGRDAHRRALVSGIRTDLSYKISSANHTTILTSLPNLFAAPSNLSLTFSGLNPPSHLISFSAFPAPLINALSTILHASPSSSICSMETLRNVADVSAERR